MNILSLSEILHDKVPDLRIKVSTTASTSNPSCSALEAAPSSNPSSSSSTSSISSGYVSFQCFRLTEGAWAHNLLEYRILCSFYH
jgi:hypothetical protein